MNQQNKLEKKIKELEERIKQLEQRPIYSPPIIVNPVPMPAQPTFNCWCGKPYPHTCIWV